MKLLIISDAWHPQVNGVVRTYESLQRELKSLGHTVKVVGPSDFPCRLPLLGYSEIELALLPARRLRKIISTYNPDYIHISTEGPLGWAARKFCLKNNRSFSTSYHTHFPDYLAKRIGKILPALYDPVHAWARRNMREFHKHSRVMMVATDSLEQELRSWGFENRIQRLVRGANLDIFFPLKEGEERPLCNNLKHPIALYVGRIAIEKNIRAFLEMEWDGSKVLIGDGPSKKELEKEFPDAVFTGIKEGQELGDYYRSSDVFVFPSKTDTFGMVLVEALACGLPIAGYNVTGPKDIVTENYLGTLTEDNLSEAAKKALSTGSPEQRAEHVKSKYLWEEVGQTFETALLK